MYGYIYETTNLINGKKYIGQHRAKEFDKKYKGSGCLIGKAFKKYGFKNFKCEIIEECNSEQELNEREIYWIDFYNAINDDNFYNLQSGGYMIEGGHLSEQTKRKISQALIGKKGFKHSKETLQHLKYVQNHRSLTHIENQRKSISNPERIKKFKETVSKHSEEQRREIQRKRFETINSDINKKNAISIKKSNTWKNKSEQEISEIREKCINWMKDEAKKNLAIKKATEPIKCPYCERFISKNNLNSHIKHKHKINFKASK